MSPPDWLVAQPIAHRGLHDRKVGIIENTASAALAAIARGFAIECDTQISAEGEAMVFHDFTLDRLAEAQGRVDALPARALSALALKGSSDRILTFAAFLDLVGRRAPVICEIKSRFDGDLRLARRVAATAAAAPGPVALKSFDPDVIAGLRSEFGGGESAFPLGIVAMADFRDEDVAIDASERQGLGAFLHWTRTRPDFLSFCVDDLPHAAPSLCRAALALPVMAWTVRRPDQAVRARSFADQIIFEGEDAFRG